MHSSGFPASCPPYPPPAPFRPLWSPWPPFCKGGRRKQMRSWLRAFQVKNFYEEKKGGESGLEKRKDSTVGTKNKPRVGSCLALPWPGAQMGGRGLSQEGGGALPCLRWRLRQGRGSDRTEAQLEGSEQCLGPAHPQRHWGPSSTWRTRHPTQGSSSKHGTPTCLPSRGGSYTPSLCNGQAWDSGGRDPHDPQV